MRHVYIPRQRPLVREGQNLPVAQTQARVRVPEMHSSLVWDQLYDLLSCLAVVGQQHRSPNGVHIHFLARYRLKNLLLYHTGTKMAVFSCG